MARLMNRLTARQVTTIKTPGMHADGGGLYLTTLVIDGLAAVEFSAPLPDRVGRALLDGLRKR